MPGTERGSAARQRRFEDRQRALGRVQRKVWVHPEDWFRLRKEIEYHNRARESAPAGELVRMEAATWTLRLETQCPYCGWDWDVLTDNAEAVSEVQPFEEGTPFSKKIELTCPCCGQDYEVDLVSPKQRSVSRE